SESTIKISLNVVEEFPCIFGVYNHDDVALRLKELRRVIKAVKAHRVLSVFSVFVSCKKTPHAQHCTHIVTGTSRRKRQGKGDLSQ
ncbi:MAG: hypothetical protein QGH82_00020, partial [Candidatus Woesearchaeota archaeon]|nr:hypothetical protein [Candidatus Woesearchaeota archaeon]